MWFRAKCPVAADEQRWVDDTMSWFADRFGTSWLASPVVLPTDDFFPAAYTGTEADMRHAVAIICEQHHRRVAGKVLLSLDKSLGQSPLLLVATVARELAHERLAGVERVPPESAGSGPLVDLLTVYLGFGIFTANAALEFSHVTDAEYPQSSQWSAGRLGHLTEPMYGYALARYAVMRGECRPRWMRFVDSNPRSCLKQGLRHLKYGSLGPGPDRQ